MTKLIIASEFVRWYHLPFRSWINCRIRGRRVTIPDPRGRKSLQRRKIEQPILLFCIFHPPSILSFHLIDRRQQANLPRNPFQFPVLSASFNMWIIDILWCKGTKTARLFHMLSCVEIRGKREVWEFDTQRERRREKLRNKFSTIERGMI